MKGQPGCHRSCHGPGEEHKPGLLDLYILGSTLTDLPSLTPWTAVCLDDEVKLVKISDHLN